MPLNLAKAVFRYLIVLQGLVGIGRLWQSLIGGDRRKDDSILLSSCVL
jgi:hypothetical protein